MSNEAGQAYGFMAMTPILKGRETELRADLEGLTPMSSPFAKLPRTHFGRWVILPDWVNDESQPREDHLDCQYLIFTSNFDCPLESYLDELCGLEEAETIWSHCIGCPEPARGAALKGYLLHNQIETGFFVAAYKDASVARVKASLEWREEVIAFAVETQGMDPEALQGAFDARFRSAGGEGCAPTGG